MIQKIRLWLIKKLKATPNEMNVKVSIITRTRSAKPISVILQKVPVPYGDVSLELIKKQALVMMESELMKHIVITDNPLDMDHIKATITVVE